MRTVYVLVHRGQRSGGLEAIHQLVQELTEQGVPARLVASEASRGLPEASAYAHYGCSYADMVPDSPESVLVVPEVAISHLSEFPRARRVVWWLSVDFGEPYTDHGSPATAWLQALVRASHNLTQSEYARVEIARREGVTTHMLSDWTVFDGAAGSPDRPDSVAYNPLRGEALTQLVRDRTPHLDWRPVEDLSREGVDHLLRRTAVYLDLGHHPGKDRIPREAALAGCVVVVGRTGSATYDADVPLSPEYKVDVDRHPELVADEVAALLDRIRADPTPNREAQRGYSEHIANERRVFAQEVADFVELVVSSS